MTITKTTKALVAVLALGSTMGLHSTSASAAVKNWPAIKSHKIVLIDFEQKRLVVTNETGVLYFSDCKGLNSLTTIQRVVTDAYIKNTLQCRQAGGII